MALSPIVGRRQIDVAVSHIHCGPMGQHWGRRGHLCKVRRVRRWWHVRVVYRRVARGVGRIWLVNLLPPSLTLCTNTWWRDSEGSWPNPLSSSIRRGN